MIGKVSAPPRDTLAKRAFRALRARDMAALQRVMAEGLAKAPPGAPDWQELARLIAPRSGTLTGDRLTMGLVAAIEGRLPAAFRHLVLAQDAEEQAWLALRDLLATDDPEARHAALRALCSAAAADRARPVLRLAALGWLAADAPEDAAAQWAHVRALAVARRPDALWPAFDRLIKTRQAPDPDDIRLLAALAGYPPGDILPRLPRMRQKGWSTFRQKLLNTAASRTRPPAEALRRPLVRRSEAPWFETEDGGAGVTAILFNGIANNPGAPLGAFDAVLAQRGIRTIHLFDDKGSAYITGAAGQPSRPATYAFLRGLLDRTPGNRVITIGNSMSAIGACAYALEMGLDGVLALAPATTGLAAVRDEIGDTRMPDFARMAEGLAGEWTDLRTWFAAFSHRPVVHLHYAQRVALDRAHARRLDGIDRVSVIEAAGHAEHGLAAEMMLRGTLGPALDALLAALDAPQA